MLDIHVLTLPGLPEEFEKERRASLELAIANAGFPVEVHEVPGIAGDFGTARSNGYSHGEYPYVGFVDEDDYVMPNAFSCLTEALADKPDAIYTGEIVLYEGKTLNRNTRHNLAVYRRELIDHELLRRWNFRADRAMAAIAARGKVVDVPDYVYVYRYRPDSPARIHGGKRG